MSGDSKDLLSRGVDLQIFSLLKNDVLQMTRERKRVGSQWRGLMNFASSEQAYILEIF